MIGMEFDYVVVGAGAAGCVLAGRLAADPRNEVLLVDCGGRPVNPLLHIPKGFYYTLRGDRYLFRYPTTTVAGRPRHEVWLRGKVLGGSAAVNGMMWMRGAPADWDGLAAPGNKGWSWDNVLPAFQAIEDHSLGPGETRGTGGPLGISVTNSGDQVTNAILASAVKYGWQHVADANAHDSERIAFTPSTIRNGRRTTSYDAYVRQAGRNLTVLTRTRVGALLFDSARGTRVTGIQVRDNSNKPRSITARKEVILCAGAIETPLLLERSGIGRPEVLRPLGIKPRIESPNVGERLIEQRGVALQAAISPQEGATFRPGGPSTSSDLTRWSGQARAALRYLATRTGPLATAGYDLVCQFKSAPERDRPDIQGLFVPMALDTRSDHMKLARHPGILFMAYPIRPQTTSSVHATGKDPASPPVIGAHFLETEADQAAAVPILRIAREVLATSPVADLIVAEEFPGPGVSTPEEVIGYSLTHGGGIYHAVGSAAMGPNDDDVTDPRLRVRGTEGLRIADASVLPAQVSGNTAAPAMLVGYRAADLILADA
jgi:choline dehydrogenase-like flavoprotein